MKYTNNLIHCFCLQTAQGVIIDRQQIQVKYQDSEGEWFPGFFYQGFPLSSGASQGTWSVVAHYGHEVGKVRETVKGAERAVLNTRGHQAVHLNVFVDK